MHNKNRLGDQMHLQALTKNSQENMLPNNLPFQETPMKALQKLSAFVEPFKDVLLKESEMIFAVQRDSPSVYQKHKSCYMTLPQSFQWPFTYNT